VASEGAVINPLPSNSGTALREERGKKRGHQTQIPNFYRGDGQQRNALSLDLEEVAVVEEEERPVVRRKGKEEKRGEDDRCL